MSANTERYLMQAKMFEYLNFIKKPDEFIVWCADCNTDPYIVKIKKFEYIYDKNQDDCIPLHSSDQKLCPEHFQKRTLRKYILSIY